MRYISVHGDQAVLIAAALNFAGATLMAVRQQDQPARAAAASPSAASKASSNQSTCQLARQLASSGSCLWFAKVSSCYKNQMHAMENNTKNCKEIAALRARTLHDQLAVMDGRILLS